MSIMEADSESSATPNEVENASIWPISTPSKCFSAFTNTCRDSAITPSITSDLVMPVTLVLFMIFMNAAISSSTSPRPATPLMMVLVFSLPIFAMASAKLFSDTAIRINPAPLNTPKLLFLTMAIKAASSNSTTPSPVRPFTIMPVSSEPIFSMVLANMEMDVAIRIRAVPLNTPSFAFLVNARNAANSSSTAPRPAIPLTMVPVSRLPIFLMALANMLIETAKRINPVPLNMPRLAFFVRARKIPSSSSTAPSPAIPFTMVSVSMPPIF